LKGIPSREHLRTTNFPAVATENLVCEIAASIARVQGYRGFQPGATDQRIHHACILLDTHADGVIFANEETTDLEGDVIVWVRYFEASEVIVHVAAFTTDNIEHPQLIVPISKMETHQLRTPSIRGS
jgi:hypothetical protein